MITPRTTRLLRVADLQAFREAVVSLACLGAPFDARDRLIVVPTHAAAAHLIRSIENRRVGGALILPDVVAPGELIARLAERLPRPVRTLTAAEREVLLGTACRAAAEDGCQPPFRLRPGLVAEILAFYDALQRNQKDVDTFERLALGALEPAAGEDRGAERLVRQTRFLAGAFRRFQARCLEAGAMDEHALRREVMVTAALRPWRHIVIAVGDSALDPHGLCPADWDLLARVPGLEALDIVATDTALAGAFHERIHHWLPEIDEVRHETNAGPTAPTLLIPSDGHLLEADGGRRVAHTARDREEEVAGFARLVRQAVRSGEVTALDRIALVVRQPLPYVYLAREVCRSAAVPCQMFDALPLAAEPYAAALDLVFACVSANFARTPALALLQSPHFRFPVARRLKPGRDTESSGGTTTDTESDGGGATEWDGCSAVASPPAAALTPTEIAALDKALSDAGHVGGVDALDRLVAAWESAPKASALLSRALRAAKTLASVARALLPLRAPAPAAEHLAVLLAFLTAHENPPDPDDPLRERQLRARGAVLGTLITLQEACARFDPLPVEFEAVAATVRRWIEAQTFAPRTGDAGVHLVDAASAPFGDFELVQLAGLIDGEWPDRPRRSIFYSPALLRELGWPRESVRLDGARAAFRDLLRLPSRRLVVSTFTLEDDGIVGPSALIDEVEAATLHAVEYTTPAVRVFEHEALGIGPVDAGALGPAARTWAGLRLEAPPADDPRFRGATGGYAPAAYSLSALERYQDCPFKYFAADVLKLEEPPDDEASRSPRARGRFIHEVFQRVFETWHARGGGTITPDRVDAARALFDEVVTPMLAVLPEADASLERARLFGSAAAMGIVDVVLGLEASRPAAVQQRWLEYRLEGEFSLGVPGGRRVPLKGVADRIDLLVDNRIRVIDYKSGYPPNPKRALQVPIYALCARERLADATSPGGAWAIDEAAYVAFAGRRALVPVVRPGAGDAEAVLASARDRLLAAVDGIGAGEFPPKPHDQMICSYCAYASVCRKDYVEHG